MRTERLAFWAGFLLYAVSLLLPAVAGRGVYTPELPSVAGCTLDWFLYPLIYIHLHNAGDFFTDDPIKNVSITISGWINPAFLFTVLLSLAGKTPILTRVFRNIVIVMMPFCWIAFRYSGVYPREGYFLWTGAMLLVLLSTSKITAPQSAPDSTRPVLAP
jgi:hypothetical protein